MLDSSVIIAFERWRFDFERLLADYTPPAIATITAAELLIGVERADTVKRRERREAFVNNILARVRLVPFELPQAPLFATHFAELAQRGQTIGDRDLQIAVTAIEMGYVLTTLNVGEFQRVRGLQLVDLEPYVVS